MPQLRVPRNTCRSLGEASARKLRVITSAVPGPRVRRRRVTAGAVALLVAVLAGCDVPPVSTDDPGVGDPQPSEAASDVSEPTTEVTASEVPQEPEPPASAPEDGPVGFATLDGGTTGGAGGETVTVSTADEFTAAISAEGPAVVEVDGTIELTGMHDVATDKTIRGGTVSGGGLTMSDVSNVIVQDMTFTGADDDAINIEEGSTRIWIDHNDFSNGTDGLVDIKRGSDFVTVSWNHFHDHDKTALLGHSDDNASQDEGHLRVTYHHNWFDGTNQRHPRVRFGDPVHVFNNYYLNTGSYGIASTMDADVVAEGNYFEGVDSPIVTQTGDSAEGNVVERDNVYDDSGEPETRGTATEPGTFYDYTLDAAAGIPALVSGGAGPR
jgi:pectate lyase